MRTVLICVYMLLASLVVTMHAHATPAPEEGNSNDVEVRLDNSDPDADTDHSDDTSTASRESGDSGEAIDAASGSLDDSIGSIEAGRETRGQNIQGDLRVGYTYTDEDSRDASDQSASEWTGRFRAGGTYSITEKLVFGGRLASTCSTDGCNPDIVFDSTLPKSSSIAHGDITFDQL